MRRVILSLILACAASGFALAQDQPAAQPDPAAPQPPESSMEKATPSMQAPEGAEQAAPTGQVGETAPPTEATDSEKSADTGTSTDMPKSADTTQPAGDTTFTVTEEAAKEWIGRPLYSSDNKRLGEIAALQLGPDGKVSELRADIGGFLGFGETRVRITADQIKEVKDDSLVVTLTESEAKSLPAIDKN